jgi:replicative DNA helicase
MKLFSQQLELRAIKSITQGSKAISKEGYIKEINLDASSYLLASLDETYFHYEPAKAAYSRITNLIRKRSSIISYYDLLEDLSLNEEYRDILSEFTKKPVRDLPGAKSLVENLSKYRKARILYYSAKNVIDRLKSTELDVDKLLDDVSNRITEARTQSVDHDPVLVVGKDANALDLIDEALSVDDEILLKTGFSEFDRKNGGLPSEGVFLLAGTTSGGKSALRMNLLKNMYKLNRIDVATVSFEMNPKKETRRLLSSITDIPFWKFTKKALSRDEREQCHVSWKKFHKFGVKNDCRYAIMCPTRELTIDQTLMLMKPYGFKVIAIDYVSLLDGVDTDNQARILKSIIRVSKIFSGQNHCLIVILAQLDEDDNRIRYSKGMLEDADNSWIWNYTKPEDRDRHRLPIKQKKARDQELFDFELEEKFSHMQVLNPPEELERAEDYKKNGNKNENHSKNNTPDVDPLEDEDSANVVD